MPNPLDILNISLVQDITTEQFISVAHKVMTVPLLLTFFVISSISWLIIGLWQVKESRGKFMTIWILSILVSGIVLGLLVLLPNFWFNVMEVIRSWF